MGKRGPGIRGLVLAGGLIFCVGTIDPLEGSILILLACALIAAGTRTARHGKAMVLYWWWTFGLMAVGVAALWGLSAFGGVGGDTGRSYWWLLVCLPYPVAWIMAFGGIIVRIVRYLKRGRRESLPMQSA